MKLKLHLHLRPALSKRKERAGLGL